MKQKVTLLLLASPLLMLSSCKPVRVDPLKEIEPNETGFIIPLESGDGDDQQRFESIDFLKERQIALKRVIIPQRYRSTGYMWYSGEWIPSVRVLTVDRTPVTRNWIYDPKTYTKDNGTSTRTFGVESSDSIGFSVGVNLSAYVDEVDTATYLYYYRGNDLAKVLDSNVREKIHTVLSDEFGSKTLQQCKSDKTQITKILRTEVREHFKNYGITITSIGLAEGLTFDQDEIQNAINASYIAEMKVEQQKQEVKQQEQINIKMLEEAKGQRAQAEEFAAAAEMRKKLVDIEIQMMKASALVEAVKKWDGKTPTMITGESTNLLMSLK